MEKEKGEDAEQQTRRCYCNKNKKVPEMKLRSNQRITRGMLYFGGRFVWYVIMAAEGRGRKSKGVEQKTEGVVVVAMVATEMSA